MHSSNSSDFSAIKVLRYMVAGCLRICQWSVSKISCPAADMSTPESGSTFTSLVPEVDVILLMIVGVGTVVSPMTLWTWMWLLSDRWIQIALVDACEGLVAMLLCRCYVCLLLHTLAKCPILMQKVHVRSNTGATPVHSFTPWAGW